MNTRKYTKEMVGMIHYCSYWRSYSLILDVTDSWVTELDAFPGTNERVFAPRRRLPALEYGDEVMTVADYYATRVKKRVK